MPALGAEPILHYALDESSGVTASDGSGQGHQGTLVGGSWTASGRLNGAVEFSGQNQYIELPANVVNDLNAVTVTSWVKLSANPVGATLFDFGSSDTHHFYLATAGAAGVTLGVQLQGGTAEELATSYALPVGVWKHVAAVMANGSLLLYLDGLEVASRGITAAVSGLGETTSNYIGHSLVSAANLYGTVDEFRVYDRQLSRQEIARLASPGTDYLHFDLDEVCGTQAHDSSDRALVADLPAGGSWASGRVGGAVGLDGLSQYLSLPSGIVGTCADLTVAFWVLRTDAKSWARLWSFGQSARTVMSLAARTDSSAMQFSAKLNGDLGRGGPGEQQLGGTMDLIPQTMWSHVALVLQAGVGRLYFDGQEAGSASITIKPSDLGSTITNTFGQPLYAAEPYLAGRLDELRISCRAFPASEIRILALAGQ